MNGLECPVQKNVVDTLSMVVIKNVAYNITNYVESIGNTV